MATERNHIRNLIDKLEGMPPERLAEIEDFIDFLRQRDQERELTRSAARAAEPSLRKIWDNPDDSVYDSL